LFFEVLAKTLDNRKSVKIESFKNIPYLNSSLFEPTELERKYLRISNLKDNLTLKKFTRTILKEENLELGSIEYLLKFLNAYDFGSNEKDKFKNEHNTLINSAVLGLIFEKLNGYKDGSFFTPAFVTMYMTKQSIRKSVEEKFNLAFGINTNNFNELKNYCELHCYKDEFIEKANNVINAITIVDPAVGSGHFLVSALNELISIKSQLGVLKGLNKYQITNENDELYIENQDGFFEYKQTEQGKFLDEVQNIQKLIFEEKLLIIENQLFGVDINPNSVKITRLRLWVELLKDSYYDDKNELVTLPNIDINIKCGNSLISKFPLIDAKTKNKLFKEKLNEYKIYVKRYKETNNKNIKKDLVAKIQELKQSFSQKLKDGSPEIEELKKLLNGKTVGKLMIKGYIGEFGFKGLNDDIISKFSDKKSYFLYSRFGKDFDPNNDASLFGDELKLTATAKRQKKIRQEKELKKILGKYEIIKEFEHSPFYKNSFEWRFEFPEVLNADGDFIGFDIVIGNPPYLSNKDISADDKKAYDKIYNLSDDLYNYFFIKSFQLLKEDGLLSLITSNTFMTINSKINVRHLLQSKKLIEFMPIKNPFEEAAIEPIIVFAQNVNTKDDYTFDYVDLRKQDFNPLENRYKINIDTYKNTPSQAFFIPTEHNKKIHTKYISKTKELLDLYWDKISTSKNISKNEKELNIYRNNLKAGEITLIGLIADGGQGLATANNGKYIAVKYGTKEAIRIKQTRIEKLEIFNKKNNQAYTINDLCEFEIRELFDKLKEQFGRDIFGQGYLFKIVSKDEIANVATLTDEEKANGIDNTKSFVPYDKGDRDGNQWYLETPFYINWNVPNVKYLQNDKRARFQGSCFYFREGFSWSDILNPNAEYIKSRQKGKTVNDVKTMALYPFNKNITAKYITILLNSYFIFAYLRDFINNTVSIQINDIKQIPIIVPTKEQLIYFENIFDIAKDIKLKEFSNQITKDEAKQQLDDIQKIVDATVYELYGFSDERIMSLDEHLNN